MNGTFIFVLYTLLSWNKQYPYQISFIYIQYFLRYLGKCLPSLNFVDQCIYIVEIAIVENRTSLFELYAFAYERYINVYLTFEHKIELMNTTRFIGYITT